MERLKVHQAARLLSCSEAFLRRAERKGRIPKARRDLNGWRVYTQRDIQILRRLLTPKPPEWEGSADRPEIKD